MENKPLLIKAMGMSFLAIIVFSVFIFGSAGNFRFSAGWMYLGILSGMVIFINLYFFKKDPSLLERRTQTEKEKTQVIIQSLNGLFFLAMLLLPGLDFRFGWTNMPVSAEITGNALVVAGYVGVFFVFRQNSYAASNIDTYAHQQVISTGLYSMVRHPMYTAVFLIVLATPVALGSCWAFLPAAGICMLIVARTLDEEKMLAKDLSGYTDYCKAVRYRFLPFIW